MASTPSVDNSMLPEAVPREPLGDAGVAGVTPRVLRIPQVRIAPRVLTAIEIALIVLFAVWVTRPWLNFDPQLLPTGQEIGGAIQMNHTWTLLKECGTCALWFGNVSGGLPSFAEPNSSHLYPLVVVATLLLGVINGAKITLIGAYIIAGLAQWWLARVLGVGLLGRLWSAAMALVSAHLAARMGQGLVTLVVSVAACTLVLPPLIELSRKPSYRRSVVLGVCLGLAGLAGQMYAQEALAFGSVAALILLPWRTPYLKRVIGRYALALGIGVLLAAPFLVPGLHFGPYVAKVFNLDFEGAQPLGFVPLNLVIDDMKYYTTDLLGKFGYPAHYANYIGWIPLLLAVWGLAGRYSKFVRRAAWFLAVFAVIVLWAASGGLQLRLMALVPFRAFGEFLSGTRSVAFMSSMAVPPILALAALGVDRILREVRAGVRIPLDRALAGRVGTPAIQVGYRWLLLVPLLFAVYNARSFSQQWIGIQPLPAEMGPILAALRTPSAEWVATPYGDSLWMAPGAIAGLKLARTHWWSWRWRDRPQPDPVLEAVRGGDPPKGTTVVTTAAGARIVSAPDREYAAVKDAGGRLAPCVAQSKGGIIDVDCYAPEGGQLRVLENSFPGWQATLDDQPTPLVDDMWLTLQVPAGQHRIALRYKPWDVPLGLLLALAGGVLSVYLWRKKEEPVTDLWPETLPEPEPVLEGPSLPSASTPTTAETQDARVTLPWPGLLALALPIILALLTSVFVVGDRWANNGAVRDTLRDTWRNLPGISRLALPPYFLVTFACFALLVVFFVIFRRLTAPVVALVSPDPVAVDEAAPVVGIIQRRVGLGLVALASVGAVISMALAFTQHRLPGWDFALVIAAFAVGWIVADTSFPLVWAWLRQNAERAVVLTVFLVALSLFLASTTSWGRGVTGVYLILLIGAAALLVTRYRPIPPILLVMVAALVLYTLYIDGWWTAIVGDEYAFLDAAREIVERQSLSEIGSRLFSGTAVYGTHPYFSSLIMASTIKLFGPDNFGWRFINPLLSAASVGLFYAFFKAFVRKEAAFVVAVLLAGSQYIMSFGKIGYNNLQALFMLGLALWAAAWAVRSGRHVALMTLGLTLGVCFYVYPAALYVIPIALLLLLFYRPPLSRRWIGNWALTLLTMVLVMAPLFLQPAYWATKIAGTAFNRPELVNTPGANIYHTLSNFVYTMASPFYIVEESHYVAVSYADPVTAALFMLGLALLVACFWRKRFYWYFMAAFAILIFLVGISHDRDFPSATRMFLMLPWWAFMATVGLLWIVDRVMALGVSARRARVALAVALAVIVTLNVYQAYPLSRTREAGRYQQLDVVLIRFAQQFFTEDNPAKTLLWINDPRNLYVPGMRKELLLYNIPVGPQQIAEVQVRDPNLPPTAQPYLNDRNTVIIVSPRIDAAWAATFQRIVRDSGRVECSVKNETNYEVFKLWIPREMADKCAVWSS